MTFAILVENVSGQGAAVSKNVLAHSFAEADETFELTRRLATSFPEHGFDPSRGSWWFRDNRGLHRLLVAPDADLPVGCH